MNLPLSGDYINIHNHGSKSRKGVFSIENIMAHEERIPDIEPGLSYSIGIHPWHLSETNLKEHLGKVKEYAIFDNLMAVGETGFDRIRGPALDLQRKAFEEHVKISVEHSKPVFIHCVRAWDELLASHKRLKPTTPWMVHGFRGKKELALQLISRGMYISFWIEFILRPESAELLKNIPANRIFLETDGSDEDITDVYNKVAADLEISIDEMKSVILNNFITFFKLK
jgi:TatD DNase family protein